MANVHRKTTTSFFPIIFTDLVLPTDTEHNEVDTTALSGSFTLMHLAEHR